MSKVDYEKTLFDWAPSDGAVLVVDSERLELIIRFCAYVAAEMWGKIGYFERNPEESKKLLESDGLSKNSVFEEAANQLREHKKVWQVTQTKFPSRLTYELPLVLQIDDKLRYMKFQIDEGVQGLASPNKVKQVWLRYHVTDQTEIRVVYVEK